MSKNEIYVSIDVEADGPIPGRNNMLSFGAAAFDLAATEPRTFTDTFEANLDLLPEATPSEATMDWWAGQPAAWEACRKDTRPVEEVMPEFVAWIRKLGKPVIVGFPVTYDFMFLYWYTMAFGGLADGERCPYGFQGLDLKTLAWARMGGNYKHATKRNFPKRWFRGSPKHNHEALTDAIGQGVMFVNMALDV
tara:strand:+ start:3284 stop:3862 length:579 start_codon:yes stop_codon:yes gene_type:complete